MLQEQTEGLLYGAIENTSVFFFCFWVPVAIAARLYLCLATSAHWVNSCFESKSLITRKSREICYLLFQVAAARLCASIALISTRKLVVDLHKVGTCSVLVKCCVIWMHISGWGPGRNILCFSSCFQCRDVFCLHFHCCFVSLDLYSLLFCTKNEKWNTKYL